VEIAALGQILTDESVGVLVESGLPGMVGVGEVALGVKSLGDGLMVGELLAVVIGERVDKVGMKLQCCEQGVRDGLCGLVGSLGNDARVLRSASVSRTGLSGLPITVSAPSLRCGAFLDDLACHP